MIDGQRRKLLEAYYVGAVDVLTLREEQERLRREAADVEERLRDVDATLARWQEILGMAFRFSTVCANAYKAAPGRPARSTTERS